MFMCAVLLVQFGHLLIDSVFDRVIGVHRSALKRTRNNTRYRKLVLTSLPCGESNPGPLILVTRPHGILGNFLITQNSVLHIIM